MELRGKDKLPESSPWESCVEILPLEAHFLHSTEPLLFPPAPLPSQNSLSLPIQGLSNLSQFCRWCGNHLY